MGSNKQFLNPQLCIKWKIYRKSIDNFNYLVTFIHFALNMFTEI